MHELVHLDFVIEARNDKMNQLFVADPSNRIAFSEAFKKEFDAMRKMGYSEQQVNLFSQSIFDGLNLQVYNTPIDLFIEQKLYNDYPKLRPFQFLSLISIIKQGIEGATNELIQKVSPKKVFHASKVLNLVLTLQFKDLYGYDFLSAFKPSKTDMRQAEDLYQEYLEYAEDRAPGEEYELVQHWAEDLEVDAFSELISEIEYRKTRSSVDNFLQAAKDNALFEDEDAFKARLHEKFLENAEAKGANISVVMYMVQAHQLFSPMTPEEIKKIAFEIAMLGSEGIRPEKSGYKVAALPNIAFTGTKLLAFYYVSWALALPGMLGQLGLPYEKEFEIAKKFT